MNIRLLSILRCFASHRLDSLLRDTAFDPPAIDEVRVQFMPQR